MAKNKKILIIISAIFIISLITAADILLKSYFTKQKKEKLEAQQTIDTIKPEIIGAKDITIKQGDTIDLTQNIKVEDNINKDIPLVIIGDIDTNKVGEYEITYTATDKSNNKAEKTIKIKIEPKELTQEADIKSTTSQKEQSQSTTNNSASTNSKQPNTPPAKEVKENKNNSSNNNKKNQGSSKAKPKGSTSIEIDERTRKDIPKSKSEQESDKRTGRTKSNYSYSFKFNSNQLDELGL
jgi:cell surface protein